MAVKHSVSHLSSCRQSHALQRSLVPIRTFSQTFTSSSCWTRPLGLWRRKCCQPPLRSCPSRGCPLGTPAPSARLSLPPESTVEQNMAMLSYFVQRYAVSILNLNPWNLYTLCTRSNLTVTTSEQSLTPWPLCKGCYDMTLPAHCESFGRTCGWSLHWTWLRWMRVSSSTPTSVNKVNSQI